MRVTTTIFLCFAGLAIAACAPPPTMGMTTEQQTQANNDWEVRRVATFRDDLAYDSRRGIYVLTEKSTGREWVGISGIGISELGSHTCGKGCVTGDER